MDQYVIFHLDAHLFAFPVDVVKHVVQVVAIRTLSQSSKHLLGVIDFHGTITPVVNLRALLGFSDKEVDIRDFLLFCELNDSLLALYIDRIEDAVFCPRQDSIDTSSIPLPTSKTNHR